MSVPTPPAGPAARPDDPGRLGESLLTGGVVVALLAILATWAPHYLTWPWWLDLDTYCLIAQGWDRGAVPYRDILTYNFPGQIYLFWALGKLFGWGRPAVIYAVDVGFLLGLGGAMLAWSRRRLGGALPGLIGTLALVAYYANQSYAMVAQRDWQGPLLAVLAILLVQAARGGAGMLLSALAFAVGFTIRPHVVLLLPAVALALWLDQPEGAPTFRKARGEVLWGLLFAAAVGLAFLPLLARNLIPDMIRGIRFVTVGGGYPKRSVAHVIDLFRLQFGERQFLLMLVANVMLAHRAGPEARRLAYPWVAALIVVYAYMPAHPIQHAYGMHPMNMVWCVNLAVLAWLARGALADAPPLRTCVLAVMVLLAVSQRPLYCSPGDSLRALRDLARGTRSEEIPSGARKFWEPSETRYRWADFVATMDYLREKTGPETPVANALRGAPVPGLNGMLGRVSPWPAEGGANNLNIKGDPLDGAFARSLEGEGLGDSVVVWSPGELGPETVLGTPAGILLERAIRAHYAPETTFGNIEVWRRKPPPKP